MGIMNFIKNPSKRMRLDLQNNLDVNVGNDDLWGPEDITAEEFDMLEVQATQEASGSNTFRQPLPRPTNSDISRQVDSAKQQQYELEGKVKILSDSLEHYKKELAEEKLKREKIAHEKDQKFHEKEKLLQKEIEKYESSLQFKEQEMKTVYDKVHVLEMQLKEKRCNVEVSTGKKPNKFLEKFNFNAEASAHSSRTNQQQKTFSSHGQYRLSLDTPLGKTQGKDIVSSILCNKLFSVQIPYGAPLLPPQAETEVSCGTSSRLSAISITRISLEQETEEIFHYSYSVLKHFLTHLQNLTDKAAAQLNSPLSLRKKDAAYDRATVISCLKDLSFIISCPQFWAVVNKLGIENKSVVESQKGFHQFMDIESATSTTAYVACDRKSKKIQKKILPLLQLLFNLANPDTYPNEYLKNEEIEWSLTALVSWSSTDFKNLLNSLDEQIIISHVNSCYSIASSGMVLKMLINLSMHEEYLPKLVHNNEVCHVCSISILLLRKISASPVECVNLMIMVEDFLSSIFTVHSFSDILLENSPCSAMVLQGILSSLWKFCNVRIENSYVDLVLKKGFTLLHYLSRYIPNFKCKRKDYEDLYISLVCEMLILSKDDPLFKDFYELAHDLWDFQEDVSEFDLDDPPDDSMQAMDICSQTES